MGVGGGKEKNMASSAGLGASLYFPFTLRAGMGTSIAITGPWGGAKDASGGRENSYLLPRETRRS